MRVTSKTTRWILILAVFGIGFLLVGAVGVASWEYTNSDAFCANACHEVHPEETYAHHISQHSAVACVECHMGRLSTFEAMAKKVTHTSELWGMLVGYDRPLTASMPASRKSCEGCHSENPHQYNSVRVRTHFAPDKENTETRIGLIIRTAGIRSRNNERKGVRAHLEKPVRFIATDPQKQHIPWVQVTRADGSTTTYTDYQNPLSEDEIAGSPVQTMECADCHNRSGHPFRNPEEMVDEALANGRLDPRFPYVKARVAALLQQEFDSKEDAMHRVEQAWKKYQEDFPNIPEEYPDAWADSQKYTEERLAFAANLLVRSKFLEPGVSWRSFPDYSGHKYAAGCFRCHSGRHQDPDGNPIPVNCTLCHTVPIIIRDGQMPLTFLQTLYYTRPPSHGEPYFMANHRTMVDETCQACHGEISFGVDDQSFCANSGCHGEKWPGLTLTAG